MHKISERSERLDVNWDDAVQYCNFVLLQPIWCIGRFKETKQQIRTESAEVRACHRSEFSDDGRSFSIKQFLYDWAPPAYDHPCLWRNAKISSPEDTPLPYPEQLGSNYMWHGLDYRRKPAATINIYRTQIELTVLSGKLEVAEIYEIFKSLKAVSEHNRKTVLDSSLAELTHIYRHDSSTISVPTGYLSYLRKDSQKGYAFPSTIVPEHAIAKEVSEFDIDNYNLDSIFAFGKSIEDLDETEYYFERADHKGTYIRIMITYSDNNNAIPYPAMVSDQECSFFELSLNGSDKLYHCWPKNNSNGSHSVVFKKNNLIANCSIKPAPWTTLDWARKVCLGLYEKL